MTASHRTDWELLYIQELLAHVFKRLKHVLNVKKPPNLHLGAFQKQTV